MRLDLTINPSNHPSSVSPRYSPTTEHDPLGSSDYIQVYNHQIDHLDDQQTNSDQIQSIIDQEDDPFQNVSTPSSLTADFQSDPDNHHQQQHTPYNHLLPHHQHPQILTTTLNLKLNNNINNPLQPSSSSPTHPQLDLSCVNSDHTDASLTSLFSFPDPLNSSIDQLIPHSRSDQYDPSDWSQRYPNHLALSSPRSDQHASLSSDHLDFKSSRSPSLTDGDLQSHTSFSSPTSPVFLKTAGSDLSHRLQVYLCGHQISHPQTLQILSNLRMNFSHLDFLTLNPTSDPYRASSTTSNWNWPRLSQPRFRQAITRTLSDSPRSANNHIGDLIYQTSWLEINFNDLTALSEHDQRSFLSSSPVSPALIIHTSTSHDCFPTDWLNELSLACPGHLKLFKVLPVLLDEKNKFIIQALVHGFHLICGLKPTNPVAVKSSTSERPMTEEIVTPTSLLLQQDTPDSMNRLLRLHDLGMMSAPSVAKLHQLLMPIEPPTKPEQRTMSSLPHSTSVKSKLLAVLACLVAVVTACALVSHPQAFGHQPTISAVDSSLFLSTVERSNVNTEILEYPLMTKKGLGVTMGPTQTHRENPDSIHDVPHTFPTINLESAAGQKQMDGNEQPIGMAYPNEPSVSEQSNKGAQTIMAGPTEVGDEQHQPNQKPFRESMETTLRPVFNRYRTARVTRLLKNSSIYHESKLKTLFSLADINRSNSIFPPLDHLALQPAQIKLWSTRLPPRLRKGLRNLRNHPKLCLKHFCQNSFPSSLTPSTCDIHR